MTTTEEKKSVFDRVKEIIIDKLSVNDEDVKLEADLVDDLNADSLDLVELIMAFEEAFSADGKPVEIADDDAGNIHTVKDVVEYLKRHGVQDE